MTTMTADPDPKVKRTRSKRTTGVAAHATADALGLLREWAKVFTLTATHCACCGKDLRDALSVALGIGPDCSREHYSIPFDITDDMVMAALGRLAASSLDERVKRAVRDLKTRPRDLCNVLVWWSSVNLNQVEVVLECSEVVGMLGFVSLSDRLRERNTNVVVTKTAEGDYILRCKSKAGFIQNMHHVREATAIPREGRFKHGWKFPATRKELVWTILGVDFGAQWATVPAKDEGGPSRVIKIDSKTYWDVRRVFEMTYNPPKPVTHSVVAPPPAPVGIVRMSGTAIEVHTPNRNFNFVAELKQLPVNDRRWDPENGCWRVAKQHEQKIRDLVAQHFDGAV